MARTGAGGARRADGRRPAVRATPTLAAVLCVAWAFTFVVQRVGLGHSGPLWFGAGRVGVGAAVMLVALRWMPRLDGGGHAIAVVLAAANQLGFVTLQAAGLETVGAGPAAAIVYTQPILVLVAARFALGEPLNAAKVAGVLLGFAGVAVVSVRELSVGRGVGAALLLGTALSWTVGTIVTKRAREEHTSALLAWQHLYAAPVLLIVAAVAESPPALTPTLGLSILYAGAIGSAFAWWLWTLLLRRGEAGVVSAWLFSVPILGAALGVALLGEPLTPALAAGVALVAVGIRLVSTRQRPEPAARPGGEPTQSAGPGLG